MSADTKEAFAADPIRGAQSKFQDWRQLEHYGWVEEEPSKKSSKLGGAGGINRPDMSMATPYLNMDWRNISIDTGSKAHSKLVCMKQTRSFKRTGKKHAV